MFGTIVIWALAALVGMFGLVALKAGAEYRFRGKTGLLIEGIGFLLCAVYGAFFAPTILASLVVLGGGIAVGTGIRAIKGNDKRYIE